jgi:hypothetical protein
MIHVPTWLIIYVNHIFCESLLEMVAYFDIEYDQWNWTFPKFTPKLNFCLTFDSHVDKAPLLSKVF